MSAGILVWGYTLLLPSISDAGIVGARILIDGPWGLGLLRPQALFGLDLPPLVHGVLLSLAVNIACYIGCSLGRRPTAIERVQADMFVPSSLAPIAPSFRLRRASATVEELIATVARYLGEERTRESFASFARDPPHRASTPTAEADFELLQYAEYLLASAIGAASSRLVLSLVLRKRTVSTKAALKLLDDANAAIHYNREILQTALDHVRQGIAVFDKELTLVCWNRQFGDIFDLPHELTRVGIALADILRHIAAAWRAQRPGRVDEFVAERIAKYASEAEPFLERFAERGLVIEVRANRMPDGGLVTTFTDITPSVKAAEALERANATLERRVRERTGELTRLNAELERAKAEADEANVSKTRFVAAASHDILQPLNAARLYVTSLIERQRQAAARRRRRSGAEYRRLARSGRGDLRRASRHFAARHRRDEAGNRRFPHRRIAAPARGRIRAAGARKGPRSRHSCRARWHVRSDRRLLRRLLQNLISNAIKYTPRGRVLVGCRRRGGRLRIEVYDTGIGIPHAKRRAVFKEFHRLDQGARVARGVGLGLSIVERIARVLDCEVTLKSNVGRGSRFSLEVPRGAGHAAAPKLARRAAARSRAARRHGRALHRQRSRHPRRHGDAARRLGLPHARGGGPRRGAGGDRSERTRAGRIVGRLSPRRRQRRGRDRANCAAASAVISPRSSSPPTVLCMCAKQARTEAAHLLNKPLKPASLRALITQWRVQRVAAE